MEKKEVLSMKKKIVIMVFAVVLALGMYAPTCLGYSVEMGDWITYGPGIGSNFLTGEMSVSVADTSAGPFGYVYDTFCLEQYETMNWNTPYYVNDVSQYAVHGGTFTSDPISNRTAWLYYNYFNNMLAGYDYFGPTRAQSADALQLAIWYIENEIGSVVGYGGASTLAQTFLNNAMAAAGGMFPSWVNQYAPGQYYVSVVNITTSDINNGYWDQKQSSLIAERVVTPEPMTISLLGLGILGLGLMRRRMHR